MRGLPARGDKRSRPALLLCALLYMAGSAVAQSPAEQDAAFLALVAEAVQRRPDFGTQHASVGAARGALSEAKADFFPRVQLLLDSGEDRSVRDGRSSPGTRRSGDVNPQLGVTQLLYDGGAAWGRVRAARGRVSAAVHGIDSAANNLSLQAVQIYFTVIRQQEALTIALENLNKIASVRDKVAGRAQEGRDPRSELSRLDSRVLEAQGQLLDARRNLADAIASYEEFFGSAPGVLRVPASYPQPRPSVEEAIRVARERNAELLALRDELEASTAEVDSQRASLLWPRLSLEASGTTYDAFGPSGTDNRDTYVGLRFSYEVFGGGAGLARTRAASSRNRAARFAIERAELALERQLRQAYAAVEAREAQLTAMADRVGRDHSAIDDYEELFLAGRRSLNDLIVAQRDYFASATQLLDVQLDLRVQRFSVAALTGELGQYFGIEPPPDAAEPRGDER